MDKEIIVRPSPKKSRIALSVSDIALIGLFTALTAVSAFIKIPGPIVPFTAQTIVVALCGVLLGAKRAAVAQVLYIILGLVGFPIFTGGGGLGYVVYPTFGYLLGFVVMALICGFFTDKCIKINGKITLLPMIGIILASLASLYICGVAYYMALQAWYVGTPADFGKTLWNFVVLFLPTDIAGGVLVAVIGPRIRKALARSV